MGWAEQVPADPGAVRDEVREVLSGRAYDYSPSVLERVGRWLSDRLEDLLPGGSLGPGGTFGGGIGSVLAWVLIAVAVATVVAVAVVAVRRRVRRPARPQPAGRAEVEHRRPAGDWIAEAERLEAAGAWKEALRARYRSLVRVLTDRGQLPDVAGRTTGELRADLAVTTPSANADFDLASTLFELAWYAGRPTGAEENARFRAAAHRVLAAEPTAHLDPLVALAATGTGPS